MSAGQDSAHSTLEVVPRPFVYHVYHQEETLPTDLGKQVAPHSEKQVILEDGKQPIVDDGGLEVLAKNDSYAHGFGGHHVQAHRGSRKKRIVCGGIIGAIVILAAVLGTVFGLKQKSLATTPLTSHSNSSATSPPAKSPPTTPARPSQRNIAAVSFAANSVNNTRVYFQDSVGHVMEAANSADNTTWSINDTGTSGKNGSAIAAAVSRPGFPLASHVSAILLFLLTSC